MEFQNVLQKSYKSLDFRYRIIKWSVFLGSNFQKMTLAYTVCSSNYLGYAQAMFHSFRKYHADIQCVVGLVDRVEGRIATENLPFVLVEAEEMNLPNFEAMAKQYTMHELTCAMKPYVASYLFNTHTHLSELWYFDTDMLIFNALGLISERLNHANILITPHFLSPFDDGKHQAERDYLNAGLYNAGFFALKRSESTTKFLHWWQQRLGNQGYLRYDLGMGSDQLWLNFVPLFFEGVHIETDKGFNVGYWNLHERSISEQGHSFMINEQTPLKFFHFSGYNLNQSELLSKHQNRWNFKNRPDVMAVFEAYRTALQGQNYTQYLPFKSVYDGKKKPRSIVGVFLKKCKSAIVILCWKILKKLNPDPTV